MEIHFTQYKKIKFLHFSKLLLLSVVNWVWKKSEFCLKKNLIELMNWIKEKVIIHLKIKNDFTFRLFFFLFSWTNVILSETSALKDLLWFFLKHLYNHSQQRKKKDNKDQHNNSCIPLQISFIVQNNEVSERRA